MRVQSVMKMVISTSCPITLLDQQSFREMINVMDQKFKMPGLFFVYYKLSKLVMYAIGLFINLSIILIIDTRFISSK